MKYVLAGISLLCVAKTFAADDIKPLIDEVRKNGQYSCAECHGETGTPPITDKYDKQSPILAGQKYQYLYEQLQHFKAGTRYTNEMDRQLFDYSDTEIKRIAKYFAEQKPAITKGDPTIDTLKHSLAEDKAWVAKGKRLFEQGDESRSIIACAGCHNSSVQIESMLIPQIEGQYARYIRMTLKAYQNGVRTTDAPFYDVMRYAVKPLTDDDIKYLAAYIQSL